MGNAVHPTDPSLLADPARPFVHRDLSWLSFNERVLSEAQSADTPLLERVKFLAISSSNLDEFFMIRFSSTGRNAERHAGKDEKAHRRYLKLEETLIKAVGAFATHQAETFERLRQQLALERIHLCHAPQPGTAIYDIARGLFERDVLPRLPAPEPFSAPQALALENLDLAALIGAEHWFRVPKGLPTVLSHHDEDGATSYYFLLDDLIATFLPGALGIEHRPLLVRLTRDGDFTVEFSDSDPESIPDQIRTGLKRREGGKPVRLQVLNGDPLQEHNYGATIDALGKALKLPPCQVFRTHGSLLFHALWGVVHDAATKISPERGEKLVHPAHKGFVPSFLREKSPKIFEQLKEHDILFHHPYDSFDGFVSFIQTACEDPQVTMIEQTVYRMDTISPLMEALKKAAATKKVRVAIELRARFDEFNNLLLTEELKRAGVEVVFGFGKLKLHAKVAVITRQEGDTARHYTHLSTGNYKAATAKQYTDMAVLTSHEGLGKDARTFFDAVSQGKVPPVFSYLVHAPARMHRRLLAHIKAETAAARKGKSARIFAKVNALVDEAVVNHLYEASQAGVKVELVVRGACSLVPGIPGVSENIRVMSIIDRFLEHSRLYYFENAGAMYLSSADWMPRNFFSRLELAFPVLEGRIYKYIRDVVIPMYLSANHKAWELDKNGHWSVIHPQEGEALRRPQFQFEELAMKEYAGTALSYGGAATAAPMMDFINLDETLFETLGSTDSGEN